jgi:small-conductance mechanosensitive channel
MPRFQNKEILPHTTRIGHGMQIPSLDHSTANLIKKPFLQLRSAFRVKRCWRCALFSGDRRWILAGIVWLIAMGACPSMLMAAGEDSNLSPPVAENHKNVPSGLSDLIPKTAALKERLDSLTRQLSSLPDYEQVDMQLQEVEANVDTLAQKLEGLKDDNRFQYERIVEFIKSAESVNRSLEKLNQPLASGLQQIDAWRDQWRKDLESWRKWEDTAAADLALPMVKVEFENAIRSIETAQEHILRRMKPIMAVQKRLFDTQVRVKQLLEQAKSKIASARGKFLYDVSPPLYSPEFFNQFGRWMIFDLTSNLKKFLEFKAGFFAQSAWVIFLHAILALAVAFVIRKSKRILKGIHSLHFMTLNPRSAAWLMATAACWSFYAPMPALWKFLLSAIILATTARLVSAIAEKRRRTFLIWLLSAILLTNQLLTLIGIPAPLFSIYLVSVAAGLAILCIYFLVRPSETKRNRTYIIILAGTAIACAVVAVFEIAGYSALALLIFRSSLRSIFIFVLAWLMMMLTRGLIESAFHATAAQKVPYLRMHTKLIIERLTKVLNALIWVLFVGTLFETWRLVTSPVKPFLRILTFGTSIGGLRITVGLVLAAVACLYGSLIASRILQFFLMRNLFSRRRVEPGIGISISRLLHYTIIFVGVLLALSTLGFRLTNLTIIASALSVGIGFGLQTIVNNFVCGLILLFERPVKVGDTIQLGDQWATIRDIGLRATIIQTFDQADIVVPNSDLITNQVTNWTLANRKMRIILSVGVAYGSDVPLVLQTLQECTRENPRVLEDPAPLIYFMGFGDSSLDFQVRAWIDDVDNMNLVRSELNQAIDGRFRERGIEIPFPQRDLHLRSVTADATSALAGSSTIDEAIDEEEEKKM